MNLHYKRIFILFSVALNIGFVIMAMVTAYHHSTPFRKHSWHELVSIVHQLDLPETEDKVIMEILKEFRETMDNQSLNLRKARRNVISLLATAGPVDPGQFHQRIEEVLQQEQIKHEAFEAHVLELRNRLGNDNGARFFSLLLEHLKDKD